MYSGEWCGRRDFPELKAHFEPFRWEGFPSPISNPFGTGASVLRL